MLMSKSNEACERLSRGVHKDKSIQRGITGWTSRMRTAAEDKFNCSKSAERKAHHHSVGTINTICNGPKSPKECCLVDERRSTPTDGKKGLQTAKLSCLPVDSISGATISSLVKQLCSRQCSFSGTVSCSQAIRHTRVARREVDFWHG